MEIKQPEASQISYDLEFKVFNFILRQISRARWSAIWELAGSNFLVNLSFEWRGIDGKIKRMSLL